MIAPNSKNIPEKILYFRHIISYKLVILHNISENILSTFHLMFNLTLYDFNGKIYKDMIYIALSCRKKSTAPALHNVTYRIAGRKHSIKQFVYRAIYYFYIISLNIIYYLNKNKKQKINLKGVSYGKAL